MWVFSYGRWGYRKLLSVLLTLTIGWGVVLDAVSWRSTYNGIRTIYPSCLGWLVGSPAIYDWHIVDQWYWLCLAHGTHNSEERLTIMFWLLFIWPPFIQKPDLWDQKPGNKKWYVLQLCLVYQDFVYPYPFASTGKILFSHMFCPFLSGMQGCGCHSRETRSCKASENFCISDCEEEYLHLQKPPPEDNTEWD